MMNNGKPGPRLNLLSMVYAAITVSVSWIIVILWLFINLIAPAVVYTSGSFVPPVAYSGEVVEVQRDITVNRDVTYTANRELVHTINGRMLSYTLPDITISYEKGFHKQSRYWQIPKEIPPGTYLLRNTACYQEFNIFQRCIKAPALPITIVNKSKVIINNKG